MEHETIYNLLKTINIPVAYDHFDSNKNITPPFMTYREIAPIAFKADGITYKKLNNFEIELITEKKDIELETQIEDLLTNNLIPYDKDDDVWDEEERIYHIFYEI